MRKLALVLSVTALTGFMAYADDSLLQIRAVAEGPNESSENFTLHHKGASETVPLEAAVLLDDKAVNRPL